MFRVKGLKAIENAVSGINKAVSTLEAVRSEALQDMDACATKIEDLEHEVNLHQDAARKALSISKKLKELVA